MRQGVAAVLAAGLVRTAAAQPAVMDAARHGPGITNREATALGAAAAVSAILFSYDQRLARGAKAAADASPAVRTAFHLVNDWGNRGVIEMGALLWGTGYLTRNRTAERIGQRSLEAIALAQVATTIPKLAIGRARPDVSPDNPRDFEFGRGFRNRRDYDSFPSGHATEAFAFAAAVDAEWKRLNPNRPNWVGPGLYGLAAVSSASRIYSHAHWASDVVMAAAIAVVSGQLTVRWYLDKP